MFWGIRNRFLLIIATTGLVNLLGLSAHAAVELRHGRYVGWIKFEERNQRIAVVADIFLESPEDLREFPRLKSIIKLSLGGYNTHEYITETFEALRYDYDNSRLSFDEPNNDLVLVTEVKKQGSKIKILGEVFVRSSLTAGTVDLTFVDEDEPDDDEDDSKLNEESTPFVSLLDGQYEGDCDGKQAAFQIQTVRGLRTKWQNEDQMSGLGKLYGIAGRVAFKDRFLCSQMTASQWCTYFDYSAGSYNFYNGKLNLHGARAADDCNVLNGQLNCRIRIQDTF